MNIGRFEFIRTSTPIFMEQVRINSYLQCISYDRKKQKNTGANTNITFCIKLRLSHLRMILVKRFDKRFFWFSAIVFLHYFSGLLLTVDLENILCLILKCQFCAEWKKISKFYLSLVKTKALKPTGFRCVLMARKEAGVKFDKHHIRKRVRSIYEQN